MTRKCAWCGKLLGEKCPRCGLENTVEVTATINHKPAAFRCAACDVTFTHGAGGITHGMCAECKEKLNSQRQPIGANDR